jgi:peptidoglycan/LPS O-acetylase OafA/YrhL
MSSQSNSLQSHDQYLGRKYMPELDGLRALSVLMVISVHMHDNVWHWLGGWQGVTVFFVLSGYLITSLALREESQRGNVSLTAFYIRRSFRIFPLYYVTLAIYCILILVIKLNPEKNFLLRGAMPWYLLYMQEIPYYYGLPDEEGVMQHTNIPFYQSWSLGIEEKFYLVWPLLAFILWRASKRVRPGGTVAMIAFFVLIMPALSVVSSWIHRSELTKAGSCLEPYYKILAGCLVALLLHDRTWYDRMRGIGAKTICLVTLLVVLVLHFARPQIPDGGVWSAVGYSTDVLYVAAVSIFLISLLLGTGPIQHALQWAPLVFIGKLSYGIYLLHILCLNIAQRVAPPHTGRLVVSAAALLLACIISVGVAYVMYLIIEKPCIDIGRRWSKKVMDQADVQKVLRATTPESK